MLFVTSDCFTVKPGCPVLLLGATDDTDRGNGLGVEGGTGVVSLF